MACFSALKKLCYHHNFRKSDEQDADNFLPQYFIIDHLASTLQELTLSDDEKLPIYEDEEYKPIGSLARFEKLRKIMIHSPALLGAGGEVDSEEYSEERSLVEVLPKSIEKLALLRCGGNELQYLRELLYLRAESVPVLKYVYLSFDRYLNRQFTEEENWRLEAKKIKEDFEAAGIELVRDMGHRRSLPRDF